MIIDAQNNIIMIRGDSENINIEIENVKLSDGDTVRMTIRDSNRKLIIQKAITNFQEGKANISINPNDTKDLKLGIYIYDIEVTFSDGIVKTIIPLSRFTIKEDVTYE